MASPTAIPDAASRPLAERISERVVGPCRVLTLKTPVRSVVSWRGSFLSYPELGAYEELLQQVTVSLLDKGTQQRDRFAVAEILENRGAQLHFYSDDLRVGFSGRALREDVPDVLAILAEQLRSPLFDPQEFEKARTQEVASVRRSMESTGAQATGALARALYQPAHPNYRFTPEADLDQLASLTVEHVRAYHEQHFGARQLILALVGDLDDAVVDELVRACFADWQDHGAAARFVSEGRLPEAGRSMHRMPDKQNIDVRLGHALRLRRQDPGFIPLYLGNYVLGGNFSARLMTSIRDEQGLTYGIGSSLSGIATEHDGHWQVSVTLSQENVERGLKATLEETQRFVEGGISEAELDEKKTTVTGSYKVSLATTGGLAAAILSNAQRGFDVGYLDRFPQEVEATTLQQVNEAIQRHLQPHLAHISMAGAAAGASVATPDLDRAGT